AHRRRGGLRARVELARQRDRSVAGGRGAAPAAIAPPEEEGERQVLGGRPLLEALQKQAARPHVDPPRDELPPPPHRPAPPLLPAPAAASIPRYGVSTDAYIFRYGGRPSRQSWFNARRPTSPPMLCATIARRTSGLSEPSTTRRTECASALPSWSSDRPEGK